MRDMGIRGRFAYRNAGRHLGRCADGLCRSWRGSSATGRPTKRACSRSASRTRNLGALTIGGAAVASRGILTLENIKRDWDGARALGLPITMHTSGASPIMELERAGLLGPDVQFIHPLREPHPRSGR